MYKFSEDFVSNCKNPIWLAAQELSYYNVPVFPCKPDKSPKIKNGFKGATKDWATVRKWFQSEDDMIGVPMGNVTCLDIDAKNQPGLVEAFEKSLDDAGLTVIRETLVMQTTINGGAHYFFRVKGLSEPVRNLVLSRSVDSNVTIETRGDGGYAVVAPSKGYRFVRGSLPTIPTITLETFQAILTVAKSFDRCKPKESKPTAQQSTIDEDSPGDDYNRRGADEMLALLQSEGWKPCKDLKHWTRPGKNAGTSATWDSPETPNKFYVFTSNAAPFEAFTSYSPFAVYAMLQHGGDYSAAAKALLNEGYGDRKTKSEIQDPYDSASTTEPSKATDSAEAASSEEDIFEPTAELWAQEIEFAKPTVGRFGDRAAFYEETTNYIFGTRACGKSWLSLYVSAEAIADSVHVVYIDPESSAKRILWRLKYIGVDPEQGAKFFHYIATTDPLKIRKVQQWAAKQGRVLVIYDGLANAIASAGKEENSSAALEILQAQVKPFADSGSTVIVVDHTGKDESKGARGHSSKEAFFKGACYHVKTGKAFSRGTGGFLKLELAKDNEGGTGCVQGQLAAIFEATISDSGKTLFKLREPGESERGTSAGRSVKMTDEEILKALPFGRDRAMKYENISPALNVRTFAERCEKIEGACVELMPTASGQQSKHFWREIELGKVEGEK